VTEEPNKKMSGLDWMGVVTLVIEAVVLLGSRMYSARFVATFEEFGADLPFLTKLVLTPAYGAVCGGLLLLVASMNFWPTLRGRDGFKKMAMVIGFVAGLGAIMTYVIGLYMPLFQVA
jgi:hypothetical protein